MQKPTPLAPETRTLLFSWAAGEARVVRLGAIYNRERVDFTWTEFHKALSQGFILADGERWALKVLATRSDKPVKPYKPRGANPTYATRNPWPCGVDEHWRRMQQSRWRAVRGVAKQLTGSDKDLELRYPQLIKTKSELNYVRKELLALFGVGKRREWGTPSPIKFCATTGAGLQALMLELLVQPEFTGGRFVRFAPVDSERAFQELDALVGATDNIAERWLGWKRGTPGVDECRTTAA